MAFCFNFCKMFIFITNKTLNCQFAPICVKFIVINKVLNKKYCEHNEHQWNLRERWLSRIWMVPFLLDYTTHMIWCIEVYNYSFNFIIEISPRFTSDQVFRSFICESWKSVPLFLCPSSCVRPNLIACFPSGQ